MQTSEQITEICKALTKVQAEIFNPKKDDKNPFFKSTYSALPSILSVLKQFLPPNGLSFTQLLEVIEGIPYLTTILMHESGQWLKSVAPIICKDNSDPQKVGGAITYMRRYSLQALIGVVGADDDDDGNLASQPGKSAQKPVKSAPPKRLDAAQLLTIRNKLQVFPEKEEGLLKWASVECLEEITQDKYETMLNALKKYEKDAEG